MRWSLACLKWIAPGDRAPWRLYQNYVRDALTKRCGLDEGTEVSGRPRRRHVAL